MSFFDDVVGKLFGKQPSKEAFIHEVLQRTEKELESYEAWLSSGAKDQTIKQVEKAYYMKKQDILSDIDVHLLDSKYSNGFAISYTPTIGPEGFRNLFDYFKEMVLQNGYKLAQADRKIIDKEKHEEMVEKWYLKPISLEMDSTVANQRFGNVLIEKIDINRKPSYIKLMANIYQDSLYTKAEPFQDLLDIVFES